MDDKNAVLIARSAVEIKYCRRALADGAEAAQLIEILRHRKKDVQKKKRKVMRACARRQGAARDDGEQRTVSRPSGAKRQYVTKRIAARMMKMRNRFTPSTWKRSAAPSGMTWSKRRYTMRVGRPRQRGTDPTPPVPYGPARPATERCERTPPSAKSAGLKTTTHPWPGEDLYPTKAVSSKRVCAKPCAVARTAAKYATQNEPARTR